MRLRPFRPDKAQLWSELKVAWKDRKRAIDSKDVKAKADAENKIRSCQVQLGLPVSDFEATDRRFPRR